MKQSLWVVGAIIVSLWVGYNFGHKQGLRDAPATIAAKEEKLRQQEEAGRLETEQRFKARDERMAAAGVKDPYLMCEQFVLDMEDAILWEQQDSQSEPFYDEGEGRGRWDY